MEQIPAIEWDEKNPIGDTTNGSATISSVDDTSEIEIGMVIDHANFAYNSRVVSKTVNTIVMDSNALADGTDLTLSFFRRFEFDYPASTDQGEQAVANQTTTRALSGARQTVTNYIDLDRVLTFGFISKASMEELRDEFYFAWAMLGKSFRYFNDKEIDAMVIYYNDTNKWSQKRQIKKHPDYLYQLTFNFTRVA